MNTYIVILVLFAVSCQLRPDSNRNYDFDKSKVYKLQLSPVPGSNYNYEMINESEVEMEVEGKEVYTINKSEVELNYSVAIDSTGNYVFTTTYEKIKLHTKSGDTETDADANNATISIDPVEKMLGILKSARIVATVNLKGETIDVRGYKELEDKLMAGLPEEDHYSRSIVKAQWEKIVGEGVVKNTVEQLFKIFPDSAIHIRDSWKLNSSQGGELPMSIKSIYTLKAINNDIAIISSEGVAKSEMKSKSIMGYSGVTANLFGEQKGEFEIETKTGMLINSRITSTVEGKLQAMGREIPIVIKTSIKMNGRKKNDFDAKK